MFPADTVDFYQIFLYIKEIIRPSKSQPYIKKKQDRLIHTLQQSIDSIHILQQKYR